MASRLDVGRELAAYFLASLWRVAWLPLHALIVVLRGESRKGNPVDLTPVQLDRMRTTSVESLRVRAGQKLTRALWNRLVSFVERELMPSGDVFYQQTATGRFFYGGGAGGRGARRGGSVVDHPWQIAMEGGLKDGLALRFRRALINGVEPVIDGTPIGQEDEDGVRPALKVTAQHFGPDQLCRIYVKATLQNPGFYLLRAEMMASVLDAKAEAWAAYKLIALLKKDGESAVLQQMTFFNQSLVVVEPRGNGRAAMLWTAT